MTSKRLILFAFLFAIGTTSLRAQGYLGKRLQFVYMPTINANVKLLHNAKLDFHVGPRFSVGVDFTSGGGTVEFGEYLVYSSSNGERLGYSTSASDIKLQGIGGHVRMYLTNIKAPVGHYLEFAAGNYGYSFESKTLNNSALSDLELYPEQITSITPRERYVFSYGQLAFGTQSIINDRFVFNARLAYGFPFPPGSAESNNSIMSYIERWGDNGVKRNNRVQFGIGFGMLII